MNSSSVGGARGQVPMIPAIADKDEGAWKSCLKLGAGMILDSPCFPPEGHFGGLHPWFARSKVWRTMNG